MPPPSGGQASHAPGRSCDPVFEERFVYFLDKKTLVTDEFRLQVTLWNHAKRERPPSRRKGADGPR